MLFEIHEGVVPREFAFHGNARLKAVQCSIILFLLLHMSVSMFRLYCPKYTDVSRKKDFREVMLESVRG